jgi:hypothetical protein
VDSTLSQLRKGQNLVFSAQNWNSLAFDAVLISRSAFLVRNKLKKSFTIMMVSAMTAKGI